MTQCSRVLTAARSYKGTCQAEWLNDTPDDGPIITRVAARIQNLEERGYVFEILRDRKGTRVYRLLSEPEGATEKEKRPNPETHAGSAELEGQVRPPAKLGPPSTQSEPPRLFEAGKGQFNFSSQEAA